MVMVVGLPFYTTIMFVTGLKGGFGFDGGVGDAMLPQFFSDDIFYLMCRVVGDDV